MVYLANLDGNHVFTIGMFGVQHDEKITGKEHLITKLYSSLSKSAGHVDYLQDERHGGDHTHNRTTTFVAYWLDTASYKQLTEDDGWKTFWRDLPDDAGVWREIMTVPKSRYMFAANQQQNSCLATMLELKASSDEAYWGVYRHRLSNNPDEHTDPADNFATQLSSGKIKDGKQSIDLSTRPDSRDMHKGRVKLANFPDNLLYCREVQAQPDMPKEELETWREKLAPYVASWMNHLDTERNKNGVVSFTFNMSYEKPKPLSDGTTPSLNTHSTGEANQLMYFLDLAHFELAGRSFKDHVTLRKNTFAEYGPDGKHSAGGKLSLAVELAVLKTGDLEAEYIGCREGTGLMLLEKCQEQQ
jgi:hypothetical protein